MKAPNPNRLALRFLLDTNVIDDEVHYSDSPMPRLRAFDEAGWIYLAKSTVLDRELQDAPSDKANRLIEAADFPAHLEPWVLGESMLGYAVLGSGADQVLLDDVFRALFPNRTSGNNRHDFRDAQHIAWAMREAMHGFITRDKNLLNASDRVEPLKSGFKIYDPPAALALVEERVRRHEKREGLLKELPGSTD